MPQPAGSFHLDIERVDGYEFRVRFDNPEIAELMVDEPPPLGESRGPNPARLLAAAIGSCLSASLQFCLSRANVNVSDLKTEVDVELVRNERRRLRIGRVSVRLHPQVEDAAKLASCAEMYEDFCVVTQSVRDGIDVEVAVDIARARKSPPGGLL
jgi:uncharacterized OsmC-like protein